MLYIVDFSFLCFFLFFLCIQKSVVNEGNAKKLPYNQRECAKLKKDMQKKIL